MDILNLFACFRTQASTLRLQYKSSALKVMLSLQFNVHSVRNLRTLFPLKTGLWFIRSSIACFFSAPNGQKPDGSEARREEKAVRLWYELQLIHILCEDKALIHWFEFRVIRLFQTEVCLWNMACHKRKSTNSWAKIHEWVLMIVFDSTRMVLYTWFLYNLESVYYIYLVLQFNSIQLQVESLMKLWLAQDKRLLNACRQFWSAR